MKNTVRYISLALILVIALFALASCKGEEPTGSTTENTNGTSTSTSASTTTSTTPKKDLWEGELDDTDYDIPDIPLPDDIFPED